MTHIAFTDVNAAVVSSFSMSELIFQHILYDCVKGLYHFTLLLCTIDTRVRLNFTPLRKIVSL